MADQWISAAKAHSICRDQYMLCERAHAGLLIGRADLFISRGARSKNALVPDWFWWARGYEALKQNWASGDFSTWTDGKHHHEAFGVRFELESFLACLPEERRADVRRSLSVVGQPDWVAVSVALSRLQAGVARDATSVKALLAGQCEAGVIASRALIVEGRNEQPGEENPDWACREWDIPAWVWRAIAIEGDELFDWSAGALLRPITGPDGPTISRLSGIYVWEPSLGGLDITAPASAPAPAKAPGRPAIPFGEEMLCEVWAQIYEGKFTTPKKADLVRTMQDWPARNGHELPDTTAKRRADLILQYMARSDQN